MVTYDTKCKYIAGSMVLEGAIACVFLYMLSEPGLLSGQFVNLFWGVLVLIGVLLGLETIELYSITPKESEFNPPV